MHTRFQDTHTALLAALACAAAIPVRGAAPIVSLSPVVVTAHHSDQPLVVIADPRAPAQPIPAQDGAEVLRGIAGFSVIRKGGTDGDPVLRGMAGSRLGVLLDGDVILGGCGNRMDPPTAYVHPAAFDRVTVLKGPQAVQHGPGYAAGVVNFERDPRRLPEPHAELAGSATIGSFGRNDQALRLLAGTRSGYVETNATRSASDDYRDGNGSTVHSAYTRWNIQAALGLTPGEQTAIEAVAARGDGEAAYADRGMDGVKFAREHLALRASHQPNAGVLQRLEARGYYNYVDHVMDNYSLRTFRPAGAMSQPSVSNPDRRTLGGRLMARLGAGRAASVDVGLDAQANRHRIRTTSDPVNRPLAAASRLIDGEFEQAGVFAELVLPAGAHARANAGVRADEWRLADRRSTLGSGMSATPNPNAGARRRAGLESGFLRLEHQRDGRTTYVGIGHAARFPDYWEVFSKESAESMTAFGTRPEHTTQIDTGLILRRRPFTAALSLFANRISDYILVQSGVRKGMRTATIARNVDTAAYGGEATGSLRVTDHWKVDASVTHVRGENRTDGLPLAQQPPLEGRVALTYANPRWSLGALTRIAAAQDRVAINQGNIAGQDIAASDGFAVLSLNGGWTMHPRARLAAGVDNVFDRAYAEHISRNGAAVPGYVQTARVMEPGRTLWLKLDVRY